MIGTLYRYPNPTDGTKFVYVGQGSKRDSAHRRAVSSFGRRYRRMFPNAELPQPIREVFEVQDQLELNELETIWMFQYHTWHGYDGGMNLTIPGSDDYKNMARLAATLPDLREKRRAQFSAMNAQIEFKEANKKRLAAMNSSPEHKAQLAAMTVLPEVRAKRKTTMVSLNGSSEFQTKRKAALAIIHSSPEALAKSKNNRTKRVARMRAKQKAATNVPPEIQARRVAAARAMNASSEIQTKRRAALDAVRMSSEFQIKHKTALAKWLCSYWNIRRSKKCTCGNHEERTA